MSSIHTQRIKGLHTKLGDQEYSTLIPFGSDGELIDMISTLDLEEELKIGGNHYFEISEEQENDIIIVKQWYLIEPKENENDLSNLCAYTVITAFYEIPVSTALNVGNQDTSVLIGNTETDSEETNIDLLIVDNDNMQSVVETFLFKGYMNINNKNELDSSNYIHKKTIRINPVNNQGIQTANAVLMGPGGN